MMITEFHTRYMNETSSNPYAAKHSRTASHDLNGLTFKASPRRRRSKAITCAASPSNASNFSVNNSLPTTFKAAQNAPKSAFAEQSVEGSPEDAYNRFKHDPSESVTMEINLRGTRELIDGNSSWKKNVEWDEARDNEILRLFSYNRLNLVLDSMCPHIAPHIVITPAEETWETEYILWQNRIDSQWQYYLCVPPLDYSIDRMLVIGPHPCQPLLETQSVPSNTAQDTPIALSLLKPVLRPSMFKHSVHEHSQDEIQSSYFQWKSITSHVHDLGEEIVTIQKALCKATFFLASDIARVLRKRYDSQSDVLSDLEPAFTWTDPAEPLLIANRRMLGAIILDSTCPFLTPHIIINSPPPQPYHLTENNTTPYTQDAAFGDRLVVEAYYTSIINETGYSPSSSHSTTDNWEDPSSYFSGGVGFHESATDSRPGSPLPQTPDDDDDHYFHFARYDDGELNEDDLAIRHDYQSIYRVSSPVQAGLYAGKLQATSRSMFYIEEDDDELPSLDDW